MQHPFCACGDTSAICLKRAAFNQLLHKNP